MSGPRRKILFGMADWPGTAKLVRELSELNWDVIRVERAARIVEAASREPPRVIIIDAGIQGGGAAVPLAAMANHPALGIVPKIVIDRDEEDQSQQWLERGASLCLPRDVSVTRVLKEAEQLLGAERKEKPKPVLRMMGEEERFHDALGRRALSLHEDNLLELIAHFAARLLRVPGVFLIPVSEKLQFFTSQRGFRDEGAEAEMPDVPYSFPRWLLSSGFSLTVDDVESDESFKGSSTMRESGLRAWSGVAVPGWDGQAFAIIFAADRKPHEWTSRDRSILDDIAGMLAAYTTDARLGFYREEGKVPKHRLNAHALQSWGMGIRSVGNILWHADFRLSDNERQRLADYVGLLGKQVASSSGRWD